jgi:transposase
LRISPPSTLSNRVKLQKETPIERRHDKAIEQLFAKLKALLRKAEARTKDALWTAIGQLIDAFEPDECRNYIRNCGYDPV